VAVPVVQIRIVWVSMHNWRVPVQMRMGFARRIISGVHMLMMFVVRMTVLMFQRHVSMFVLVVLREVKIEPERHQQGSAEELVCDGIIEQCD
jgi:hypothetical protein